MTIAFLGIDLAKNVFAAHGVNTAGKAERMLHNLNRRAQQLGMTLVPTTPAAQAA